MGFNNTRKRAEYQQFPRVPNLTLKCIKDHEITMKLPPVVVEEHVRCVEFSPIPVLRI